MEKNKRNKGITLIALVITIIILLILAGITISTLTENGLFEKAKISKLRSDYASAKERIEIKLMEVQADCIGNGREYTIVEIAKSIMEDKEITIEKYYNKNTSLIKTGITENLVNLEGIVVSVNRYSEYKFLLGESCKIEGVTMEEITDTTTLEDFTNPEEFEKEVLGKVLSSNNGNDDNVVEEPKEEIKDVPAVGEDVDTTNPIEITTYMSIKSNSKNTLNLTGVENATYTVQEKTSNVSLSENILTANSSAGSADSCKIQITGTYSGQSYINNLTVYVEPKNITTVEDEDGNTQEAFAIYTVQDLIRIQELVNSKANNTFNAKMMNDIDLADIEWKTIGCWKIDETYPTISFKGIFDGSNYTISNLNNKEKDSNYWGAGFIGVLECGTVKNIKFNNPYIEPERACSGIAVGFAYNNCIIENIKILNGEITSISNTIGGIVGDAEEKTIVRNCYNGANITSSDINGYIGGICGHNYKSTIENCYNTGIIYSAGVWVGGISGANTNSVIQNCYNTATVTSAGYISGNSGVGGVVGFNCNTSTVINCYNTGDVTGTYPNVGGIVGHNGTSSQGTQTVNNVFNTGTITKETSTATDKIGTTSDYVGTLIGGYGTLSGNYDSITKEEMAAWDSETILQNLGENFKLNTNSNLNDGLPILSWQ